METYSLILFPLHSGVLCFLPLNMDSLCECFDSEVKRLPVCTLLLGQITLGTFPLATQPPCYEKSICRGHVYVLQLTAPVVLLASIASHVIEQSLTSNPTSWTFIWTSASANIWLQHHRHPSPQKKKNKEPQSWVQSIQLSYQHSIWVSL